MKIIKLEVEGFRSLEAQTWCPGDLNVVIGPNASGKSNLLRSRQLCGQIAMVWLQGGVYSATPAARAAVFSLPSLQARGTPRRMASSR